ncbi:SIS domain-containing protein [Fervidicoccus fontis]|uniref:SIS domain-containing protein n=1 Tax=Fervidicoccus fontis TaxID=683846 RepID=A0A843AB96_9CREN|nr:SIS domain-containing protein [Fervidicoccus fontis]MBE9391092.1 SIS domain-containing protein [Fervidicoccus fontis]
MNKLNKIFEKWYELAKIGLEKGLNEECIDFSPREIVIVGMGGSGIVGNTLEDISHFYGMNAKVTTVKSNVIPFKPDERSLFIVISYSGNTIETLSAYKQLLEENAKTLVITSGGLLEKFAIENKSCMIKLTPKLLPRGDFPEIFYSILGLLVKNNVLRAINNEKLHSSIEVLKEDLENYAKNIANEAKDKIVIFISSKPYLSVAIRFKNDFAENSKSISFVEEIPEFLHNSIEGINRLLMFYKDRIKILSIGGKMLFNNIFYESFKEALNLKITEVDLGSDGVLNEIARGFKLSGLVSLKLASIYDIDPDETSSIDVYKEKLSSVLGNRSF